MKNQSRKEFCKTCLWAALAGLVLPLVNRVASAEQKDKDTKSAAKLIAYCGIDCSQCPAYIATQKNDDRMRAETAQKWSAMFNAKINPADINCDGCPSDSKQLFSYCSVCEIRKCARLKKMENCAHCSEYPCAKLSAFLVNVPAAKATLEEIRKNKS